MTKKIKLSNEEILEKIEELGDWEMPDFISSLNLTPEQMELLAEHEDEWVRRWFTKEHNLTEKLIIKLSSDESKFVIYHAFNKLENLNSLKKEELESAYDLINNSKYIGSKHFEETFNYIANKFPELSKLAKIYKVIVLKGKKDLK